MNAVKKAAGYVAYALLSRVNLRYMFPQASDPLERARTASLRFAGATIGAGSYVRAGGKITVAHHLSMGSRSKIGPESRLYLFDRLEIGHDVEIGPSLMVYNNEHTTDDPSRPLTKQGAYTAPVKIGNDVYIGARVTLLKDTVIHDRVIVAAGAVVRGTLESGFVYGGVPARKIKPLP